MVTLAFQPRIVLLALPSRSPMWTVQETGVLITMEQLIVVVCPVESLTIAK
jgi:hypothetical protein